MDSVTKYWTPFWSKTLPRPLMNEQKQFGEIFLFRYSRELEAFVIVDYEDMSA